MTTKNLTDPQNLSESLTEMFGSLLAAAVGVWVVMLSLGALHTQDVQIPALGYFYSFLVLWILQIASGISNISLTERVKRLGRR